jgi:hypothetical protein
MEWSSGLGNVHVIDCGSLAGSGGLAAWLSGIYTAKSASLNYNLLAVRLGAP